MYFTEADLATDPIPAGRYIATVEATRHTRSRRGNPMVVVRIRIPELDRALHDYFVTGGASDAAVNLSRRRLATLCAACGFQPEPGAYFDLKSLHQQPVSVDIVVDAGETGPWNRVTRYSAAEL